MKFVHKAVSSVGILATTLPLLASAQSGTTIQDILQTIKSIMDLLVPIFITLGLIYFLWGLAEYILSSGDSEAKSEGRDKMIFGIIALFVMVSVWGLVGVVAKTFGVNQGGGVPIPSVPRVNTQ